MEKDWGLDDGNREVQEASEIQEAQEIKETQSEEQQKAEERTSQTEEAGTYHWVNPDYQKRQEGAADTTQNTYESENYRENVGGAVQQNISGGSDHQNQGYHSDWQNQAAGPETGQRRYGSYQFAPETPSQEMNRRKNKVKKPMGTGKKFLVAAGMALVFGTVAGGAMFGVNRLANYLVGEEEFEKPHIQVSGTDMPSEVKPNVPTSVSDGSGNTVADVASACMPSVVSITNASVQTVNEFFGGVQQRQIESSGSGIIVGQNDEELLIATNNHVVDKAQILTVAFSDKTVCEAQTKGTDPDNDLAVIAVKLDDMTPETLQAIKIVSLGDSDSMKIGEQVVAIGNALGYGQSVTSGWVSAVNRQLTDQTGKVSQNLIQTDAAINPGNSGGALLNMRGELIGINVAKTLGTEVEGMGYAIPVSKAKPILDDLMNRQTRYKVSENKAAYMGVVCLNVEASAVQMYGIPQGAFVESVEEGGPAETAGIQKGDVIVKFDGLAVAGSSDLVSKLQYYEAGEVVEAVISRAENGLYKEQTVTVTLGRRLDMKQSVPRR